MGRWAGRGRFQGPRSHSWNDGTWSQSWRCKINGPVVASIYSWGFQLCLVQSGGSADDPCWVSIPWVRITRGWLDPARVRCWVLPSTGLGRVVPDPEAWAGRELSVWPWETVRGGDRQLMLVCDSLFFSHNWVIKYAKCQKRIKKWRRLKNISYVLTSSFLLVDL